MDERERRLGGLPEQGWQQPHDVSALDPRSLPTLRGQERVESRVDDEQGCAVAATCEQLERQLAAHRRAAATHRRAELLHGAAARQANAFGDQKRELRERGLEAAQAEGAAIEDERARLIVIALDAL